LKQTCLIFSHCLAGECERQAVEGLGDFIPPQGPLGRIGDALYTELDHDLFQQLVVVVNVGHEQRRRCRPGVNVMNILQRN